MTSASPAVSVLMTVHNAGRFLAPAVRSIWGQTWRDLELIVVDNGSTDGALEALVAAEPDPRLRVFRAGKNLGIAAGTNRALAAARGRWVAIMDHDDVAHPDKLQRQVAWLEARPLAVGVAARTRLIAADGSPQGEDFTLLTPAEHRTFTAYSQAANFGSHLFRRDLVEALPRREVFPFSSDFDFIARANERGEIAALPEVLFDYRVHGEQTTRRRRGEQLAAEGAIRLLTACRRAGRAEPIGEAAGWVQEFAEGENPAGILRRCGRRCLAMGFPELAVYHARRALGVELGGRALRLGLAGLMASLRRDPRAAVTSARLFLTGPIRTFGLRPWPRR